MENNQFNTLTKLKLDSKFQTFCNEYCPVKNRIQYLEESCVAFDREIEVKKVRNQCENCMVKTFINFVEQINK